MEVKEYEKVPERLLAASAVTIGNFDGVHLGHRAIIGRVLEHARFLGVVSAVVTFDPHPRQVIFRGQAVPAIIPFTERARLFGALRVDYLFKVNFTPEFSRRSAGEFLEDLFRKLRPRMVVIGHDFRFGRDREGDFEFLQKRGAVHGFQVEAVPAVEVDGRPVSSSRIRALIQAGEIRRANRLLGSAFAVEGEVVPGHQRGKLLGFATANLRWNADLIPAEGVYAAVAQWNDHSSPAVVNIGFNPTFHDTELSLEAHLLNFQGDLYQKRVRLFFYRRLRGEIKFNSPEELIAQIRRDVQQAREVLAAEGAVPPSSGHGGEQLR